MPAATIEALECDLLGKGLDQDGADWMRASYEAKSKEERFLELVLPLRASLLRVATRMTGDATRGEDLVSDALLRAYAQFARFTPGTNFKAWIFHILRNLFVNRQRYELRRPHIVRDVDDAVVGAESRAGGELVAGMLDVYDRLGDEVQRAVRRLPASFRTVFLLAALGDYSYREIAGALRIPLGTVMSRLFRARDILAKDLRAYYESNEWAA
jgi:RNA polymerase sigma-70 factor, ECF subfamily